MNSIHLLGIALVPAAVLAQQPAEKYVNPYRNPLPEIPPTVAKAKVLSESVSRSTVTGGKMTIQVVAPPLLEAPPAPVTAPYAPLSPEVWAARRAAQPTELRIFSPRIMVYPGGISLITWTSPDGWSTDGVLEAWVAKDLSSVWLCGDLTVGKCRYLLMPSVRHSTDRYVVVRNAPSLSDFKSPDNILMVKGAIDHTAAMEPLLALLDAYDRDGDLLASAYAAALARQKEQLQWESSHPAPPEEITIKFWPIQSKEYSTVPVQ